MRTLKENRRDKEGMASVEVLVPQDHFSQSIEAAIDFTFYLY